MKHDYILYAYQESDARGLFKQGITYIGTSARLRAMERHDAKHGRGHITYRVIGEIPLGELTRKEAQSIERSVGDGMTRARDVGDRKHPTEWFEPFAATDEVWRQRVIFIRTSSSFARPSRTWVAAPPDRRLRNILVATAERSVSMAAITAFDTEVRAHKARWLTFPNCDRAACVADFIDVMRLVHNDAVFSAWAAWKRSTEAATHA